MRLQKESGGSASARGGRPSRYKKTLYVVAGTVSLAFGIVGIALPVLPTTPFLLLSAACYYKGSQRLHRWLLGNRLFGGYIRNYREGRGIPARAKIFTLAFLWTTISFSVLFAVNDLIVQVLLLAIAVGVSIHVIRLPNLKRTRDQLVGASLAT